MIPLPDHLIKAITEWAEENKTPLAMLGSDTIGIHIILICTREKVSPDQASLLAADVLIQGVLQGGIQDTSDITDVPDMAKSTNKEWLN